MSLVAEKGNSSTTSQSVLRFKNSFTRLTSQTMPVPRNGLIRSRIDSRRDFKM